MFSTIILIPDKFQLISQTQETYPFAPMLFSSVAGDSGYLNNNNNNNQPLAEADHEIHRFYTADSPANN
jgi:hypothetical protein